METELLKNYLDQVIIKMDFLSPIDSLIDSISAELQAVIMKSFPIAEPKEFLAKELQISADAVSQKNSKIKEWNYYGRKREKQCCMTKDCFYIVYTKYESFEKLKMDFMQIIQGLFKLKAELQFRRIGLRYINTIKGDKELPLFDWGNMLKKQLQTIFDVPDEDDKKKISRAFQILELNFGEFNLRFQYGMHNPDFPAVIKQKLFTLDFDAYHQGLLSKDSDIESKIIVFHDAIKKMIERC